MTAKHSKHKHYKKEPYGLEKSKSKYKNDTHLFIYNV